MKSYFLKFFMLASILIFSGCSVDGIVKDSSGAVIIDAEVIAVYDGGTQSTTTDDEGHYKIDELENVQLVSVSVNKDGFVSQTQSTTLNKRGATLDFTLISDDSTVEYGTVNGTVYDTAGKPLSGVVVSSASAETMTDANGIYSLHVESSESVSVTATLENYATNSRNTVVVTDETSTLDLTLANIDKVVTFDVESGATISTKGATVELPASNIVNMDGSTFSGNVVAKVTFNQVTSLAGRNAFPGDYLGLNTDGTESVLQSYGFIDVTLEDENGIALRLADGATAMLTYPMDTNIEATPDSIPLWYYDIEKGIWVEDGVATYDADTNTYSGEVSHFTTWNLDAKTERANFNGCVADSNGVVITEANLIVSTAGWTKTRRNVDVDGKFRFINAPSNLELIIKAEKYGVVSESIAFTLSTSEDRTLSSCLVLDAEALADPSIVEKYSQVRGKVIHSNGKPFANTYVYVKTANNNIYANTNANGEFISSTFERPKNATILVDISAYIDNNSIKISNEYILDPLNIITNIGIVEIKSTRVTGCITKPDGNTTFNRGSSIRLNSAYSNNSSNVDENGNFSFDVYQDNEKKVAYIFAENNTYTAKFNFSSSTNTFDMTAQCIVLEDAIDMNKSVHTAITSSSSETFVKVIYDTYANYEYPNSYGDEILLGGTNWVYDENTSTWIETETPKEVSGDFSLTKNGVYYIMQSKDDWDEENFDGTISFTIDAQTTSLTVEDNATSYEAWAGYALEVYQGEVTVVELNKAASGGEG